MTGVVERLYCGERHGIIRAGSGEEVFFHRKTVLGFGNAWTPRRGDRVRFARRLVPRGLQAVKVSRLGADDDDLCSC
jgi:cold shock CspA family protein